MQENNNVNTIFSERIQIVLKRLSISRKDFAHSINVSYGNLSDWLNGRSEPSAKAIRAIYEIYDVNPIWLLTGQGPILTENYTMNDNTGPSYNKVTISSEEYNSLTCRAKKYDKIVAIMNDQSGVD